MIIKIGGISVKVHPSVGRQHLSLLLNDQVQDHLGSYWSNLPSVEVYIFPRSWLTEETWREWYTCPEDSPNRRLPNPYGVRGWCEGEKSHIVVLVDDTETDESVLWLVVHELTHFALDHARFLRYMLALERDEIGQSHDYDQSDDEEHERNPEEVLCNRFATVFTGADRGRKWWRARMERRGVVKDSGGPKLEPAA